MTEAEQFSALVGDIYDAALDPDRWEYVLESTCKFVNGMMGGLGKIIDLHKVEAAALADTLDGLAAAMILVDANGRIVHANAAGQAMLSEGAVLRGAGGKLSAVNPQGDAALSEIIINAENGDTALASLHFVKISLPSKFGQGIAPPKIHASRPGKALCGRVLSPTISDARR